MMSPAGFEHGVIVMKIAGPLHAFVHDGHLGLITGAETGFLLAENPDTVRAPDIGFICADRVPAEPTQGFFSGAPDLAVEVLSPNDSASQVLDKVNDWLGAGCRAVWVVDPQKRAVNAYHSDGSFAVWSDRDQLDGGEVVPGFHLAVSEIFRS